MEKLSNHIALQSIAEGGMEKQALTTAQLLRMGRNFALRGKADRFNELVNRRAQAAASSILDSNRWKAAKDARDKYTQIKDYLLDGDVAPAFGKMRSANKRLLHNPIHIAPDTNPNDRVDMALDAKKYLVDLMDWSANNRNVALGSTPKYNSEQLAIFSRALRQLDPELHKKVLTTGSF